MTFYRKFARLPQRGWRQIPEAPSVGGHGCAGETNSCGVFFLAFTQNKSNLCQWVRLLSSILSRCFSQSRTCSSPRLGTLFVAKNVLDLKAAIRRCCQISSFFFPRPSCRSLTAWHSSRGWTTSTGTCEPPTSSWEITSYARSLTSVWPGWSRTTSTRRGKVSHVVSHR